MSKFFVISCVLLLSISAFAFEYTPKDVNKNPFSNQTKTTPQMQTLQNSRKESNTQEMREIKNLTEYFKYLPNEVHRHWTPYKANVNYKISVQFLVHRDGSISDLKVVETNYPNANQSVLQAVKSGAPYQPLPKTYSANFVKAQIELEYHKQ